jgi:uncharacterized membrane protein
MKFQMDDRQLDETIGNLLRWGVLLAATVVAAGGVWYLATNGGATPDYRHYAPGAESVRKLAELPAPEIVILVGLLLLIATPVARVVFSLVAFAMEPDRTYVVCTTIVLGVLMYSLSSSGW